MLHLKPPTGSRQAAGDLQQGWRYLGPDPVGSRGGALKKPVAGEFARCEWPGAHVDRGSWDVVGCVRLGIWKGDARYRLGFEVHGEVGSMKSHALGWRWTRMARAFRAPSGSGCQDAHSSPTGLRSVFLLLPSAFDSNFEHLNDTPRPAMAHPLVLASVLCCPHRTRPLRKQGRSHCFTRDESPVACSDRGRRRNKRTEDNDIPGRVWLSKFL